MKIKLHIGNETHIRYAEEICQHIAASAKVRGTGIAKREPEHIREKLRKGNAVIALDGDEFVGFCYIEIFEGKKYVSNSGLIVKDSYRNQGIAYIFFPFENLEDRKSTRLNSSHVATSYAVFCLNK